jgi:superfamily II DNA/RNA helicase
MTVTTGSARRHRRRPAITTSHPSARPPAATPPGPSRAAVNSFADLPIAPALVAALRQRGLSTPFPIQAAALPDALAGRDVLGRGRTGSGKTLAFGLALLTRLAGRRAGTGRPIALILVPTRELAQQVSAALHPYAETVRLRCATAVGGLSIRAQADALARGAEILIATPGRLADLARRGSCRLDRVEIAVVDEADQMADIGFLPQVTALLDQVPAGGQRLLFSATLDRGVDRLVRRFLNDPATHEVDPPAATITTMTHHLLEVDAAEKQATVTEIAARDGRVMLFVGTKRAADRLARRLAAQGVAAGALHGGRSQGQRTRALEQFRTGGLRVLVATNVAARGIHIDDLDLVVNVDPPADGKDYLHRGGRTARAGRSGTVVTLVLPEQRREVQRLMTTAGVKPASTAVGPGHPELVRLTGARTPAVVPTAATTAAAGAGHPLRPPARRRARR